MGKEKNENREGVPIETETKIAVPNLKVVRQKVLELGGKPREEGEGLLCERNTFLDTPDQRLTSSDQLLRVREVRKGAWTGELLKASLTWKGSREKREDVFKSRPEWETKISNPKATIEILKRLGYGRVVEVFEKQTEHFVLSGVKIDLNKVPVLESFFVELEGTEDAIEEVADKLGLNLEQATPLRYEELLEKYYRERGLSFDQKTLTNFTFKASSML